MVLPILWSEGLRQFLRVMSRSSWMVNRSIDISFLHSFLSKFLAQLADFICISIYLSPGYFSLEWICESVLQYHLFSLLDDSQCPMIIYIAVWCVLTAFSFSLQLPFDFLLCKFVNVIVPIIWVTLFFLPLDIAIGKVLSFLYPFQLWHLFPFNCKVWSLCV